MNELLSYGEVRQWLTAGLYGLPRILVAMLLMPILSRSVLPGLLRVGFALAMGCIALPAIHAELAGRDIDLLAGLLLICKETFIGGLLGFSVLGLFMAIEAVGFFVDNQRGASIASTLNPLTGNDSSPLGILFNQAFSVYLMVSGGFLVVLGMVYQSYALWPVLTFQPRLGTAGLELAVAQFSWMLKLGLLLAAPPIVTMFMAELGLALVSRFAPQLQVFFLAMPIKSAVALFTLVVYLPTLFGYAGDEVRQLGRWVIDADRVLR